MLDHALAFDVASDAVGDTFRVVVARCHAVDAIDVPVVYVTDANITLGMTVDTIRYLCLSSAVSGNVCPVFATTLRGQAAGPTVGRRAAR